MPDAASLAPPPAGPPAQAPADNGSPTTLQPGDWVSLDGTTTAAQNGTWLAVGTQGDVWVVS